MEYKCLSDFLFKGEKPTVTGAKPVDGEKQTETDPFLQGFDSKKEE